MYNCVNQKKECVIKIKSTRLSLVYGKYVKNLEKKCINDYLKLKNHLEKKVINQKHNKKSQHIFLFFQKIKN